MGLFSEEPSHLRAGIEEVRRGISVELPGCEGIEVGCLT